MITQRPRGTQDWYGSNMHKRTVIEKIARRLCENYNIKEVSTPVFEHTVLFARGVGQTTDVVQKEMYTFDDKGGRSITLKPEGTAGAVRAYLENSLYAESQPIKMFYVTPVFRYENPQSGRLRQHHQFGVEIFGSANPLMEIEVISLLMDFFDELGLTSLNLHINSIGCGECRKVYNKALLSYLDQYKESLCETCKDRMKKNPLRILDCKEKGCENIVKEAPRTLEYLDDECKEHFEQLKKLLDQLKISYQVDTGIVRGLDYYTKTVFEFVNSDGLTICGGGRYDKLIKEIDGKQDVPAIGFGLGIERLILEIDAMDIELEEEAAIELYVGILGEEAKASAYKLVKELRNKGHIVETDYMDRSVRAQMKYANKIGAKNTLIIGENEVKSNKANIKNMSKGSQEEVFLDEIADYLKDN